MKKLASLITCILFFSYGSFNLLQGQDKAPVRVYLEHFKSLNKQELSVRVLKKTKKRYLPTEGVKVSLYISEISPSNLLGSIETNNKGIGVYTLSQEQIEIANNSKSNSYFALAEESDEIKSKIKEITIRDVNLDVWFTIQDSVKQINVLVSETDSSGIAIPQKGVEIKFLVERPLSPLTVGDDFNTTDKEGKVSMDFPDDLPGDEEGNLLLFVRIVESEDFGNVEISEIKKWGIPIIISDESLKRSLWASGANAPLTLIIFINSIIAVVWLMIFYIIFKIFKIKKLGLE